MSHLGLSGESLMIQKLLAGTIDMVYKNLIVKYFFLIGKDQKIIDDGGNIEKDNPFENCLKGLSHMSS